MTSFRGELTRYFDDGGTVREQWELSASFLAIDDGSFLIDLADPGVDIEEGPPPSCFTLVCADGETRAMQADDEASCGAWVQRIAQALSEFQPSEALLMMAGAPALDREAVLRTTHALVVLCEEHVLAAQADLQLDVASGVDVEVEQAREELVDAHKFALSVAKEHADKTAQLLHWVHEIECSTAEQETRISTQADEIRALELELSEARAGGAGGGHGWYGGYDAAAASSNAATADATRRIAELEMELRASRVDAESERTRCEVLVRRANDGTVVERALALRHEVAQLSARRDRALAVEKTARDAAQRFEEDLAQQRSSNVDAEIIVESQGRALTALEDAHVRVRAEMARDSQRLGALRREIAAAEARRRELEAEATAATARATVATTEERAARAVCAELEAAATAANAARAARAKIAAAEAAVVLARASASGGAASASASRERRRRGVGQPQPQRAVAFVAEDEDFSRRRNPPSRDSARRQRVRALIAPRHR